MEKIVFVCWDCDEQPNLEAMNEAISKIQGKPVLREIETNEQTVSVAVCRKDVSQEQAQEAWNANLEDWVC